MDIQTEKLMNFDMNSLRSSLPQNMRGLSRYYSGKSRSFACIADVHCLEDLKKPENPEAKKRKKYSPYPCRRVSSTTHCASPCVGA